MLKIKDNINLKELEKFGYHKIMCDYTKHPEDVGKFYRKSICKNGNLIEIVEILHQNIDYEFENSIQDLIQAGLVEKVVE